MCGIVGLLRRGAGVDIERIEYARDLLAHRGPDGAGLSISRLDGPTTVVLAHRRLSILDLSERGAQPLLLDPIDGARPARPREETTARLAMVFNGEIYNYVELRAELQRLGHDVRSTGDTEVLLRAYQQWGRGCLERLNGMFAFAIWDAERRELFCARDRFGEKPFYYVYDPAAGVFGFASEVKALMGAGLATVDIDGRALYRYFRFGEQEGVEQTIWKGVRRLLPGHCMSVRVAPSGITVAAERYWDIDLGRELRLSDDAAAERFAELFRESVRIRLRSDVPVGTSLSGGLDSSSVVCQIHALGAASGQKTFSARMDDPALDEGPYIDAVLRATGIPGYGVVPTADAFLRDVDDLFYYQEEPFLSTSIFASYLVHRLARDHGVVVMLDGQGADEYLAGYAHYPALVLVDLARRGRLAAWHAERVALRARAGVDPVPPRAMVHHLLFSRGAKARTLAVDGVFDCSFLTEDVRRVYADEVVRQIPVAGDALKARLYADLMMGHLQELLRYGDRNSMAFSREVRLPFLDHRLVELALSLPREHLLRGGESKRVLRRAMRGLVPDQILDRRDKVGFATPWRAWFGGVLGETLRERLVAAERSLDAFVRPGQVDGGTREGLSILALASARDRLRQVVR